MAHCQAKKLSDMDSGSFTESGGSTASSPPKSSAESLSSSKFRQEIYFKDVGIGGSAKSGADSSAATPPKKVRIGGVQSCQPPLCQVEGCKVDLRDAKAYYTRHKVCAMHSKSPKVIVAGIEQRFCQQCSRFHQLPEFDQGKRSCRRRLAGHNERRRKPSSGSLLSMGYGRRSSSSENSIRAGSFLMDFNALRKPTGRDGWSTSRSPERHAGDHAGVGKHHPHYWQSTYQNSISDLFLPSSLAGTHFPDPGKRIAPDSDSTRALSLLSNEPWASTLAFSALEEAPLAQPTAHGGPHMSHLPATFGYYKGNTCPTGLPEPAPELCPSHSHSGSLNGAFSRNVEMSQETCHGSCSNPRN